MPTYSYKCDHCGYKFELIERMRDHKNVTECIMCKSEAKQVILTPPLAFVAPECVYESPIDGTVITNRKQRIEDMARNNCMEYDPGMRQDYDRRQKESDLALDKAVDETVDKALETMPSDQKQQFLTGIANGLTAEPTRI